MEDKNNIKLNTANDLPAVPRLEDGSIDLEAITISIDEKQNRIIPDQLFDAYFRELPNKVINASKSWRTAGGGKIKILGGDPEGDKAIHRAGAEALNARNAQRRTNKEIIDIFYSRKAPKEVIERLGLTEDATVIEAINQAMIQEAFKGNTKAYELLRDTAGEKPTDRIDANITGLTAEDKELLKNVENRISSQE